ncbi:MAG TPA: NUDIX domain-containing protein [Gammaproteobacteria bacterium]|nr:NUDIX domain-containing protein [Gammaproteobacteria bacterium]
MKFCSTCGAGVTLRIPDGDNRERYICDDCQTIHYQNPNIVAGCIAEWEGRILLCKRAIEPRYGLWTLPAGFMENGETTEQAALRETLEEAGAQVEIAGLFGIFSIPHISQVYLLYRGELCNGAYEPGPESLECRLFEEHEVPWEKLAFPVMHEVLQRYYKVRAQGFPLQHGAIFKHPARR